MVSNERIKNSVYNKCSLDLSCCHPFATTVPGTPGNLALSAGFSFFPFLHIRLGLFLHFLFSSIVSLWKVCPLWQNESLNYVWIWFCWKHCVFWTRRKLDLESELSWFVTNKVTVLYREGWVNYPNVPLSCDLYQQIWFPRPKILKWTNYNCL